MLNIKKIALAGIIASFALFGFCAFAAAESIEPPAITEAAKIDSKDVKPIIKGFTDAGTLVNIYIDGIYNGKTVILSGELERINFSYELFLKLDQGEHTVWAISEDEKGNKSAPSNIYKFKIEEDVPAPILYSPVVNDNTTYNQPLIIGLARNDLKISVYIDKELNGEIEASENDLETATFTFKPKAALSRGQHLVYAVAKNKEGRESDWSNMVYFKVSEPQITSAEEEGSEATSTSQREEDAKQKLESLLNKSGSEQDQAGEEEKKKLPLDLIIFIIFLSGIVGWIVWVNKELIKEKNEQAKGDITNAPSQKITKKQ